MEDDVEVEEDGGGDGAESECFLPIEGVEDVGREKVLMMFCTAEVCTRNLMMTMMMVIWTLLL